MPIYEFKCSKCDHFFEVIVMGSQKDEAVICPKCQSTEFERVVSSTHYAMGGSSGQKAAKGSPPRNETVPAAHAPPTPFPAKPETDHESKETP